MEEIVELDGHPTGVERQSQASVIAGHYPELEEVELPDSLKPGAWRVDFNKEAACGKDKDRNKK